MSQDLEGEFEITKALLGECEMATTVAPTLDFSLASNSQNLAVIGA